MITLPESIRRTLLPLSILVLTACLALPAAGQRVPPKPVEPTVTSAQLFELGPETAIARKSSRTVAGYRVALNPELFTLRANAELLTLDLPDGARFPAAKVSGANRDGGDFTWHGRFVDVDGIPGDVVLTFHEGQLAGLIYAPSGNYRLGVDDDGTTILEQLGRAEKARCAGDRIAPERVAPATAPMQSTRPSTIVPRKSGTVTVDVLLVYTVAARNHLGSSYASQMANAIDAGNVALANSGSSVRLNLVNTRQTSYSETGDIDTDIDWLETNSTIAGWRDLDHADMVGLVLVNDDFCGSANGMDTVSHTFASRAFQATAWDCLDNLTLHHEFGHILGLNHNPGSSNVSSADASYPYAFGHYVDDFLNGFTTVMAYDDFCTFCPVKPYFSNPGVDYGPFPTGTSSRDNQRVLDEGSFGEGTGRVAAAFRYSPNDDDRYESNDTRTTAHSLTQNERTWLSDLKGEGVQKNEDWYQIYVDPGVPRVVVELKFDHADGDIDVALHNVHGVQLASSTSVSDDERINYIVPDGGSYYLRVYYGNAGNTYDLWWDDLPLQPDLTIPTAAPTATLYLPDRDMTFDAWVRNDGPLDASASTVRFYRSSDATITTSDTDIGSIGVDAVAAGAIRQVRAILRGATADFGSFWVGACVDPVASENPTDNQCSPGVAVTVSGPDLRATDPVVGHPSPMSGGMVSIEALVGNYGGFNNSPTTARFFLSTNDFISTFDTELDSRSVQSLDPLTGLFSRRTVTLSVPPGNYWLGVCVDEVNNEIDTTNQCSTGVPITVVDGFFYNGFETGTFAGWASYFGAP